MVDRRTVLQVAGVAGLGLAALPGCGREDQANPSAPPATPDDQQSDELALIAAYDAAIANAGTSRAAQYQRIRDEHAAHLHALGWDDVTAAQPSTDAVKRNDLIVAERRAIRLRTQAARTTDDSDLAQILALIAASEAQHLVSLEAT
ncbi:MAG: hypothetical protein R2720_08120 [Candidatus Nanopelagicales bacterium]